LIALFDLYSDQLQKIAQTQVKTLHLQGGEFFFNYTSEKPLRSKSANEPNANLTHIRNTTQENMTPRNTILKNYCIMPNKSSDHHQQPLALGRQDKLE